MNLTLIYTGQAIFEILRAQQQEIIIIITTKIIKIIIIITLINIIKGKTETERKQ